MKAGYKRYLLQFKRPSGTSRGILVQKETWFLWVEDGAQWGIGECGRLPGLSVDDVPEYEDKLKWVCEHIHLGKESLLQQLQAFPSIQFGLEQAFLSLQSKDPFLLFPNSFSHGQDSIAINGLIWMGDREFMSQQITQKLQEGFRCIKMKIGAIAFDTELELLHNIRKEFPKEQVELRVDANGAFTPQNAMDRLKTLAQLDLHSIEQPIKAGQWEEMAYLCAHSPLAIALDEELIGIVSVTEKQKLLQTIKPQYIILKPSLVGGYKGSEEWIKEAEAIGAGWWVTSALESNIGLNAIAQWTYSLDTHMPQGLGTGGLYTNNLDSPLEVRSGRLHYNQLPWQTDIKQQLCT